MKKLIAIFLYILSNAGIEAQQSYQITFIHDGKTVFGTFTTPNGTEKFPTVIINPGSGANDRDGTIQMVGGNAGCLYPELFNETLKPYKDLSDALVDSGFAVLRYDKLEFTYPSTLGTITFHKLWLPVESAINYVKTRSDVDTNKIILLGHSEGSSLIPFIARNRTDIKALISIAGARTPFDSILAYQLVYIARTCGGDTALAHFQASQVLSYFETIRTNSWDAGTPPLFGVPASAWYEYVLATDSVAINYNIDNLCTLFIGMGLDINVPPAELERFRNEVTITDDFWSIPDHIHFMTPYNDPHVSETLTDTIVSWLKYQCLSTGIHDPSLYDVNFLNVSPNPFNSSISLFVNDSNVSELSFSIFDTFGNMILTRQIPSINASFLDSINLSYLPSGVYYIAAKSGSQQTVKKIVKN